MKKKKINYKSSFFHPYLIILVFLLISNLPAYVQNRSSYGDKVKWKTGNIRINLVTQNSSGLSSIEVIDIVKKALGIVGPSGWKQSANLSFTITTSSSPLPNINDIYFTKTNADFFGLSCASSGVIGKTETAYRQSSGEILEVDILLNDNCLFERNPTDGELYLGNVVTHELGHLLGLGHSEVSDSTMFYLLNSGQGELHSDDKAGIGEIYPTSITKGSIRGTLVGSNKLIGVMGGQIEAISTNGGSLVASAISDANGNFLICGLPLNDTYYLYIHPSKYLDVLPYYYLNSKKNFCNSETDYRGSFFQTCFASENGFPQGIKITNSSTLVNIGIVSIGCSLNVASRYLDDKQLSSSDWKVYNSNTATAGNAVVGSFTKNEFESGAEDVFIVDLSTYDAGTGERYLDVKLVYQDLYSPIKLKIETLNYQNTLLSNENISGYSEDLFGKRILDITEHYRLATGQTSQNYYTIKIVSDALNYSENDFLDSDTFLDKMRFYFLIVTISEKEANSYSVVSSKVFPTISDNLSCPQGVNTYPVLVDSLPKEDENSKKSSQGTIGCGTIDTSNQGPPSSGGLMVGFFLVTLFNFFYRKAINFRSGLK